MPHNENLVCGNDLFMDRMRYDTCAHACTFSSYGSRAAKELCPAVYGYDHLVASAPQRQIQCFDCVLAQFFQIVAFAGNTNAHCRSDLIADMDLTYTV